jgi:hypothetical protein
MVWICENYGGQSGIRRDFSNNTPALKIHYHFTNAPPSYSTSIVLNEKNSKFYLH